MSGQSWEERYCHVLQHQRWLFACLAIGLILLSGYSAWQVPLTSTAADYYPAQHLHMRLYQEFPEMLKMTNTVVMTISVKDGTIYHSETLAKIHRLTVGLLETPGVNPHAVMSITHKRLQDIKIRDGMINITPIVRDPGKPQPPEELDRIKNAVYTNLGIRGVYVSPDNKTALIRAGFWDGQTQPRAVFERLRTLAAQEGDTNTDVAFAGNMVLAGWLVDAAPRVLLLLCLSAVIALVLAEVFGQTVGLVHTLGGVLLVNLAGAACGFGLLGLLGRSLEPLALLLLFPLCGRGLFLVLGWSARLRSASHSDRAYALTHTARALWRPSSWALGADGASLLVLFFVSDVPAVRTFGLLGAGWLLGLLVALWLILPVWSCVCQASFPQIFFPQSWGTQLVARIAAWFPGAPQATTAKRATQVGVGVLAVLAVLGVIAGLQLEAGRSMLGSRLFSAAHPYSQAFALINTKFIGINQLIVVAHTPEEAGFRDLGALQTLEAFQHHMAVDEQFGGAVTVPDFVKTITRMFHENIPKWAILPDDINSTGQIIFRIVAGATTPSEVERFLSKDFRTTAVTLFYQDYSPAIVERTLERIESFRPPDTGTLVELRFGGGLLGVVAAIHDAVAHNYWCLFGGVVVLTFVAGLLGLGSLQAASMVSGGVLLSQAVMLILLWVGDIDLNMHTLPLILVSTGTSVLPLFFVSVAWPPEEDSAGRANASASVLIATGLILGAAACVWLLSPLRLQTEMGIYLIVFAGVNAVIPVLLQSLSQTGDASLSPPVAQSSSRSGIES